MIKQFILLFLTLLFLSCEQSEVHDKYKILLPNYILDEQSKSVIMPLHIGNIWIYQFTEYDKSGKILKNGLDTIIVVRDTLIGYDRWFIVNWLNDDNNYLKTITNTDIGLYDKYSVCGGGSNIEVQYPATYRNHLICKNENTIILVPDPSDDTTFTNETVSAYYWCDNEFVMNISVPSGLFNCYKYCLWFEVISKKRNFVNTILSNSYYTPDIGLIKYTLFNYDRIRKEFELISYRLY